MLTLKITGKDYNELHKRLIEVGSRLYEYNEEGYFDEGGDEWVHRGDGYELDYEEGEPALSAPRKRDKPELSLKTDKPVIKKKTRKRNGKQTKKA